MIQHTPNYNFTTSPIPIDADFSLTTLKEKEQRLLLDGLSGIRPPTI